MALAFFNKSVTLATKRKMVNSLETVQKKVLFKHTTFDFNMYEQRELDDFVSKKNLHFKKN